MSRAKPKDPWVRSFEVCDPERHHKGYTIYKVTSRVYPVSSPEAVTEIVVWRRYNDFKKLYQKLSTLHKALHRKGEFPIFAKPKVFGRFDEAVIEERRKSALDLLNFVAAQSHLFMCDDFQSFFEGGDKTVYNEIREMGDTALLQPFHMSTTSEDHSTADSTTSTPAPCEQDGLAQSLGGVWKYRKPGDTISLNDDDDDDDTSFTDDSALSTPLPDTDITFFDPLNEAQEVSTSETSHVDQLQVSNSWLLSAMNECTELKTPEMPRKMLSAETNLLELPSPPEESPDKEPSTDFQTGDMQSCEDSLKESVSQFDPLSTNNPAMKTDTKASELSVIKELASRERSKTAESVTNMDLGGKDDYIYQAANQISLAKECEANGKYDAAFGYYKSGVGILLKGVQGDTNKSRRDAVRRKTAQYLLKAEDIYKRNVASKEEDSKRWASDSNMSAASEVDHGSAFLLGPISELRNYKVLGVIDKVMLVFDKVTEDTFVIKVLHKSGIQICNKNVIPTSCPYMVRFYRFYETDSAIYILLQHASGGKLWNYLSSYLNHSENIERREKQRSRTQSNISASSQENVYSGQHLLESDNGEQAENDISRHSALKSGSVAENSNIIIAQNSSGQRSLDSDLEADTEVSQSYVELFTDYASTVGDVTEFGVARFNKSDGESIEQPQKYNLVLDNTKNPESSSSKTMENTQTEFGVIVNEIPKNATDVNFSDGDDVFENFLTRVNQPSLEHFSINSIDSDSERKDSYISETDCLAIIDQIPSIPEEIDESDKLKEDTTNIDNLENHSCQPSNVQYSCDGKTETEKSATNDSANDTNSQLPDADDLISSAKELLKSVEEVLADIDSDTPIITPLPIANDNNSEASKYPENRTQNNSLHEQSIYDVSRSNTSDISSEREASPCKSQDHTAKPKTQSDTALEECLSTVPPLLSRQLSQSMDHSLDSPRTNKTRPRALSNVFSDLDRMVNKVATYKLPESCVRQWIAEIITAVGHLHSVGIICCDLRPDNILLGDGGHVLLTFFSKWAYVNQALGEYALDNLYAAPELKQPCQLTAACDWWSVGALLYELLTGYSLIMSHPAGVTAHTQLIIPDHVSEEARSLLQQLLTWNPMERIGCGINGTDDIKSHPFFTDINWRSLVG